MRATAIAIALGSISVLAGCTRHTSLPESGPTVEQIWQRHNAASASADRRFERPADARAPVTRGLASYSQARAGEIRQRFRRLPNPELTMYVYPHLTDAGHPVPGYVTVFSLYPRDHFAKPGEIAAPTQPSVPTPMESTP